MLYTIIILEMLLQYLLHSVELIIESSVKTYKSYIVEWAAKFVQ